MSGTDGTSIFENGTTATVRNHIEDPFKTKVTRRVGTKLKMLTSQYVEGFIKIKDADSSSVKAMDLTQRRYLKRIYDTPSSRILLMTSRQTEKSTTLGNRILSMSAMRSVNTSLFVSPSATQTKVFSTSRVDDIINVSPMLRSLQATHLTNNLLEKHFLNHSKIYLRYAFLNADRIRGLSVNNIFADEVQDLIRDLMPVIEETASHHKDTVFIYSGTPKTFDNTIEYYWSQLSTQNEWVVPCERHGTPKDPSSWHWVVFMPNNLGKNGPICDKCGGPLRPDHPMADWVQMKPGAQFEGFRICRLMVPWYVSDPKMWARIAHAKESYTYAKFMNEVMALSYDNGTKPLTRQEIVKCCDDRYLMNEEELLKYASSHSLFGGIDWGTGEGSSYTLITIGGYVRDDTNFQILFAKRYEGHLADPDPQLRDIIRLIKKFRLKYVCTDMGMGFVQNKRLISIFGPKRIHPIEYVPRQPAKLRYIKATHRYRAYRTLLMADLIAAIKMRKIRFPKWSVFMRPYADDMVALTERYSETTRQVIYDKIRGVPDDTFHSILYTLLASMFEFKRLDIISPMQDVSDEDAAANIAEAQTMDWISQNLPPDYDV